MARRERFQRGVGEGEPERCGKGGGIVLARILFSQQNAIKPNMQKVRCKLCGEALEGQYIREAKYNKPVRPAGVDHVQNGVRRSIQMLKHVPAYDDIIAGALKWEGTISPRFFLEPDVAIQPFLRDINSRDMGVVTKRKIRHGAAPGLKQADVGPNV